MLAIRLKEQVSSVGSSRDHMSISPRSCVNFVRSAQAEIVCRFRWDRVSISPGDILEFIGVRLRFRISSPRWRIVGREKTWKLDETCGIQLEIGLRFWKGVRSNWSFLIGELLLLLGFGYLLGFGFLFWVGIKSNWGFLNLWDCGYK